MDAEEGSQAGSARDVRGETVPPRTARRPGTVVGTVSRVGLVALALVLAGCGDLPEDAAVDQNVGDNVTPEAQVLMPEGRQAAQIVVENGKFAEGDLILQQNLPTFLRVDNRDDQAYRFEIEGLVDETAVPAATPTLIDLTAPEVANYQGRLLPAQGDEPLATLRVSVESPAGNS